MLDTLRAVFVSALPTVAVLALPTSNQAFEVGSVLACYAIFGKVDQGWIGINIARHCSNLYSSFDRLAWTEIFWSFIKVFVALYMFETSTVLETCQLAFLSFNNSIWITSLGQEPPFKRPNFQSSYFRIREGAYFQRFHDIHWWQIKIEKEVIEKTQKKIKVLLRKLLLLEFYNRYRVIQKTSRSKSQLALRIHKLLQNALYYSLVERLRYLLRCCMVIFLSNNYQGWGEEVEEVKNLRPIALRIHE